MEETGTFSIIGCKIFEDEIAYLINNDETIKRALIQRNESYEGIKSKLNIQTKVLNFDDKINPKDTDVVIKILPLALHENPQELKEEIKESVQEIKKFSEEILLFYGLCGNALKNFNQFNEKLEPNLTILKKEDEIIDDCICLALNGNEKYLESVKEEAGTFFLTPMWAKNWRKMFEECNISRKTDDLDLVRYVFNKVGYKRALKLKTGLGDKEKFKEKSREFAKKVDLELEERNCEKCINLIEENYYKYKKKLN